MFSLSDTIDDFEKDIEDCSNYYLFSFALLFLTSLFTNFILSFALIFNNFKNKICKKKTNNIGVSTNSKINNIGSSTNINQITEIELPQNNPIYRRQNLPEWVIREYLENKK